MTTRKTRALTILTFVYEVMSLLFNTLPRFIIAFLPRSKHGLISWLQSPSVVIFDSRKWNLSLLPLFICHDMVGPDAMILIFGSLNFKSAFSISLSSLRGSSSLLTAFEWYPRYIWSCWCFPQQSWFQLVIHPTQHFEWCTLHIGQKNWETIYSLDVLLSQFGTSPLFHVQF